MRVAALFSGGKDSAYAVHYAQQQGYEVACLVSAVSKNTESYMYHTINSERVPEQAKAMGIKLYQFETEGIKENEIEDLKDFLSDLKKKEKIEGVVSGALASEYQKTRIEKVCHELGLASISPLWHVNPETYMRFLIDAGFDARIAGVFAEGLDKSWIGKRIDEVTLQKLKELNKKFGIHIGFEGGEAETTVVYGPGFKERVQL